MLAGTWGAHPAPHLVTWFYRECPAKPSHGQSSEKGVLGVAERAGCPEDDAKEIRETSLGVR